MNYVREFIQALEDESKLCREQTYKLEGGTLLSQTGDTLIYNFRCERPPSLAEEQTFELQVAQNRYECAVVTATNKLMQIAVSQNLGEVIARAQLHSKQKQILDALIERLSMASPEVFGFADKIFSGASTALKCRTRAQYSCDPAMPPNSSQAHAVEKSFSNSLSIIWGPPGTGKTRTIARAAEAHLRQGRRVLLVAHANTALDAAMEDVAQQLSSTFYAQEKLLRLCQAPNPRLMRKLPLIYTAGREQIMKECRTAKVDALRKQIDQLEERRQQFLNLERISDVVRALERHAHKNSSCRTVTGQSLEEAYEELEQTMKVAGDPNQAAEAKWRIGNEIASLSKQLSNVGSERLDVYEIEDSARLVGATVSQVFFKKFFETQTFDVVIVDEASMVSLPQLYWTLTKATQAVTICGDFKQLPPVVRGSSSACNKWLKRTIFDLLDLSDVQRACRDQRVAMLDSQYRMTPPIAALASDLFYGGKLKSAESTASLMLQDRFSDISPLVLIDTSFVNPPITAPPEGSKKNLYSAELCARLCQQILAENGDITVGIVSPYRPQVNLIQKLLGDYRDDQRVTIDTVHKFQGAEARVIIFDCVDGPGSGDRSMLDDSGRNSNAEVLLNVALTRARCKFYMVSNCLHFRSRFEEDNLICRFLDEMEHNGMTIKSEVIDGTYVVEGSERRPDSCTDSRPDSCTNSRADSQAPAGQLLNESEFWDIFFTDLDGASERVVIASPYMTRNRSRLILPRLASLRSKGVEICVVTKPVSQQKDNMVSESLTVSQELKELGAQVTEMDKMHQKLAIIDNTICWEGSLNILSHKDTREHMRRLKGRMIAAEHAQNLRLA